MKEDILMLIKYIYGYSISIPLAELTVLIPLPLLHILPLLFLAPRIEFVPKELEVGFLLLLYL